MTSIITFVFQLLSLQITSIECGVGNNADAGRVAAALKTTASLKSHCCTLTATAGPHTGSY